MFGLFENTNVLPGQLQEDELFFSGTKQMCNRINLQTTQEHQVYYFSQCVVHSFFFSP